MLEAGYAAPEIAARAQKLAELVVKECAEVADVNFNSGFCPVGHSIVQHFGLEDTDQGTEL